MAIALGRRGFLRLLGAAPAAPIFAKQALEQQLAQASGVSLIGAPFVGEVYGNPAPFGTYTESTLSYEDSINSAMTYMRLFGLPEHVEADITDRARGVQFLDPDIASKKSWSWSVKIQEQRSRNRARLRDRFEHEIAQTTRRKTFRSVTGFDWPFGV